MKNIKAFIFDMDGVIASTDQQHKEAWDATAKKIGVELDEEFEKSIKGLNRPDSLNAILNHFNIEKTEKEFEELLKFKNDLYISKLSEVTKTNEYPDIEELLTLLKKQGKIIVLSSASFNAPTILDKLGLRKYFDGIVDPSSLKKSKPDPEIVIKAIEISGFDKSECVLIEDAQMGIDAGNAAGITTIAFEPNGKILKDYSIRVEGHKDIIDLINGGQ